MIKPYETHCSVRCCTTGTRSPAEDGLQALARLAANRPDAVIMDVMMPRLDGLEATRMLRAAGGDAT